MVASGALRFVGRVAIVTGAGGGLGREYALLLAERGAAVVVNDLGVDRGGEGKSSSAADKVVKEITSKGGKAVADYNSVEDGEKIVKTAIDNFGRIDILINNAGILRDRSFANITDSEWDLIHRVHLRGSFLVTKAAWPYFRKQKYGRVIMTSSAAGIYGNFGQSNYSSAKLGLLGLSNTLAIEGSKYDIHCNTIVPMAASRLTQDILPPDMFEHMKPVYVGPVVAWLCHEECPDTGGVFEAAGGWVGKYRWQRSIGKAFIPPSNLTPESVRDNWSTITDMTGATTPANVQEQTVQLAESLSGSVPSPKREKLTAVQPKSGDYVYEQDSPILYALAVGMSTKEPSYLNFLYEGSDDFKVLPTFGTIAAMPAIFGSPALQEQVQQLNADPSKLLHGEQYLELYGPLPTSGVISTECRLLDVLDKGSGALVIVEADSFNEHKQRIAYSQWSVFLVGSGGFGGKRSTDKAKTVLPVPQRKPDAVIEEKISEDQAALYRLCGDKNPIHIDPSFAAIGGFSTPILHGLCSLGYSTKHVLKQYANYDVKLFNSVMARFANPIVPGHTLRTEMWREGNRIHFQSLAVETGKLVISGAYVDLKGTANEPSLNSSNIPSPVAHASPALKSDDVFSFMSQQLADMPDLASKIRAVYEWNITKDGKPASVWTVDLKTGNGRIVKGTLSDLKPGCTLIIDDDDMIAMVSGKLDPQKAFMSGKLKLRGNIMLTQKLRPLLQMKGSSAGKTFSSSAASQGAPVKNEPSVELKCDKLFLDIQKKLKKDPDLASSIQTVYQWNVLKSGKHVSTWTLDLKNDSGAVYRGVPKGDKPDCVFIMEDDLLSDIMTGKADPQKAFMSGKLRITGNVLASQKLHSLWENPRDTESEEMESASSTTATTLHAPSTPVQPPAEVPAVAKSDFVFEVFAERLNEEPELAKKMKVIYNWNILRSGKKVSEWTVDLKTGTGSIYRGPPKSGKADVTITMDDEDVIQLMLGKLNPQKAFMTGRLKIKGNIMLTQKLNQLWQEIIKSERAVELPILSAILSDKPFDPTLRSEAYFVELGKRVSRMPELISAIQTVYQWNITKNGVKRTEWILDLKSGKALLYRAPPRKVKPTCTLTIDDDAFSDWVSGRLPGKQVLSSGRLKIDGDTSKVAKLMDSFKPQAKL